MIACPECASADVVGVEVRGVYDGVLYWVCRSCDLAFVRWPLGDRLGRLSEDYVALHNEARRG